MGPDRARSLELVELAKSGDTVALADLYERYFPRAVRIAALRMGRRLSTFIDSEDVAQEALTRVFTGLESFEAQSDGSFQNWVALCVERRIRDAERERRAVKRGSGNVRRFGDLRRTPTLSVALAAATPTPSEVVASQESEDRLESALLDLKPRYRELIIQRFLCEKSYAEMARDLDLDESTVREACGRALEKLRSILQGE